MIKDAIMLVSVILFIYMGWRVETVRKKTGKNLLLKLTLFYVALGIAIFFYYVRDFYVYNQALDFLFGKIGGTFHTISFLSIFLFSVDIFYSEKWKRYAYFLGILLTSVFVIFLWNVTFASEIQVVKLDKEYVVTHVYFPDKSEMMLYVVLVSMTTFLPILSFLAYGIKVPAKRRKALTYCLGIAVTASGTMLCLLISPILARVMYLLGAVICYYAFKMKS